MFLQVQLQVQIISTGGGNDTITMTSLAATDTIDGGAGADTLVVSQAIASATVMGGVSNVETLEVTGANDVDLSANVSTTTFDFTRYKTNIRYRRRLHKCNKQFLLSKLGAAAIVDDADGTDSFVNLANVTYSLCFYCRVKWCCY